MNLHQFYFDVWTLARNQKWRIGQALFNHLLVVRPDLAESIRGDMTCDPFHAVSPTDPRYDAAIKIIEANWQRC
jgi:DICT domain-containing protein